MNFAGYKKTKALKLKLSLVSVLIALALLPLSCEKDGDGSVTPQGCYLAGFQSTGTGSRSFAYNEKGLVKTFNLSKDGYNTKFDLTYDDKNLLISSICTIGGELAFKEKYAYENGRISTVTMVDPKNDIGVWGTHRIKYDQEGRIIEYTNEFGDAPTDSKHIFEYNAQGVQTKYEVVLLKGDLKYRQIIKPAGTPVKSAESYLMEHGVPYELPLGYAFPKVDPGIGSVMELYATDLEGKIVLVNSYTLNTQKVNAKGFVEQSLWSTVKGEILNNYSFQGCN